MKNIAKILFISALAVLASCNRQEEDIFDQSSAQRINEALVSTNDLLTSAANGWLMTYYPQEKQAYGGYCFILKFNKDGKVDVASEIADDPSTVVTSLYRVSQNGGITLRFDTYNELLHAFADPAAPITGSTGTGMAGENDFYVISASADEIVLKGQKTGSYSTLVPMSTGNWPEFLDIFNAAAEDMSYSNFTLKKGDKAISATGSYRTINFTGTDDTGAVLDETVSYHFTTNGLKLYEPATINGIEIDEFAYDKSKMVFVSTKDATVTLVPYIPPIAESFLSGFWGISYKNLSPAAQAKFDAGDQKLKATEGESIIYAAIGKGNEFTSSYKSAWGFLFAVNTGYAGQLGLTGTVVADDKIKLQYNTAYQGDGNYYLTNCSFNNYLEVFGYSSPKTFVITTDNVKSPNWVILTEEGNPENYFKLEYGLPSYK